MIHIDVVMCCTRPTDSLLTNVKSVRDQEEVRSIFLVTNYPDPHAFEDILSLGGVFLVHEDEDSCLAFARKKGVTFTASHYVAFVDSDVTLPPNYFKEAERIIDRVGGFNFALEGILQTYTDYRGRTIALPQLEAKIMRPGDRGYTHNTLFRRSTLMSWNPCWTHAWEDWHLTQHVLKTGGYWWRYHNPNQGIQVREYGIRKRSRWNTSGERMAKGIHPLKVIFRALGRIIAAPFMALKRRDRFWLGYNINFAIGDLEGYFQYKKYMRHSDTCLPFMEETDNETQKD